MLVWRIIMGSLLKVFSLAPSQHYLYSFFVFKVLNPAYRVLEVTTMNNLQYNKWLLEVTNQEYDGSLNSFAQAAGGWL